MMAKLSLLCPFTALAMATHCERARPCPNLPPVRVHLLPRDRVSYRARGVGLKHLLRVKVAQAHALLRAV